MIQIIKLILKIAFFFLNRRDPKFKEEFDRDIKEMDKAIADGDSAAVSIKYDELLKKARRAKRRRNGN